MCGGIDILKPHNLTVKNEISYLEISTFSSIIRIQKLQQNCHIQLN